ncbi:MAG: ExbD/TolR family protein [Planctomycetaceae bacterium]
MPGKSLFLESSSGTRRIKSDAELDITPMIDVTFLLLIFFMVTSTMKQDTSLQIPPARHGEGISTDAAIVITVASKEGEPQIHLGDKITDRPATLGEIPAYVQQGVDDPQGARRTVIIKADRELPSGFIEEVARAANQIEGIEKFYVGVQDKR